MKSCSEPLFPPPAGAPLGPPWCWCPVPTHGRCREPSPRPASRSSAQPPRGDAAPGTALAARSCPLPRSRGSRALPMGFFLLAPVFQPLSPILFSTLLRTLFRCSQWCPPLCLLRGLMGRGSRARAGAPPGTEAQGRGPCGPGRAGARRGGAGRGGEPGAAPPWRLAPAAGGRGSAALPPQLPARSRPLPAAARPDKGRSHGPGSQQPARSGAGPGPPPVPLHARPAVRLSARLSACRTSRFDGGAAEPGGKGGPRGCALPRGGVGGVPPGAVRGPAARSCPRRGPGGASGSPGGGTQRCPGGPSPPSSRDQRRRSAAAGLPPCAPRAADPVSPRELRAGVGRAGSRALRRCTRGLQPSGAPLGFPEPWARLCSQCCFGSSAAAGHGAACRARLIGL